MVLRSDVLIGRRYLAIRGAKPKAKIRCEEKESAETQGVQRHKTRLSCKANRQPPWLLLSSSRTLRYSADKCRGRGPRSSLCARVPPGGIIASTEERFHHEETRSERIRGVLRQLHIESSGLRRAERFGIAAIANAAVVRRAKRAGRKLPVCAGKMDGEGSSRAHHGY